MDTCVSNLEPLVDLENCFGLIKELHRHKSDWDQAETGAQTEAERLVESFRKQVDAYQEKSELLEPQLSRLVNELSNNLEVSEGSAPKRTYHYHTIFKFLYQLVKVVGFKRAAAKFPHEANRLPWLVALLSEENPDEKEHWQTRFVLTVWLSLLVLAPFELRKFDQDPNCAEEERLSSKIYTILRRGLMHHDSCQQVTAYCLARYFARSDVFVPDEGKPVTAFVRECMSELNNVQIGQSSEIKLIGQLRTLAYLFKFVARNQMRPMAQLMLSHLLQIESASLQRGELQSQLLVKLLQRAGLTLLPARRAHLLRPRHARNLGPQPNETVQAEDGNEDEQDQAEEEAASANIERILELLFEAGEHPQTRVRCSAAKGIARLAGQLSEERADDVLTMILDNLLNSEANQFAWHSGCLALAELARTTRLMDKESRLEALASILGQAITYDKIKGSLPVGAHIREAACYVSWALARNLDPQVLSSSDKLVEQLTSSLLCTALFDRELQCRRAASASLQELLGRLGAFQPKQLQLLTNLDYQAVGQRHACYLELAPRLAGLQPHLANQMAQHLLDTKLAHWDVQLRRLASDSLSAFTLHLSSEFMQQKLLPRLLEMGQQRKDCNGAHGALLALAKCLISLSNLDIPLDQSLPDWLSRVAEDSKRQLASKPTSANFTEAITLIVVGAQRVLTGPSSLDPKSKVLTSWQTIALSALDSDSAEQWDLGAQALRALYAHFYKDCKQLQDELLVKLLSSLASNNESSRCGSLTALALLAGPVDGPESSQADTPDLVLQALVGYLAKSTRQPDGQVMARAKATCCQALVITVRQLDQAGLLARSQVLEAGLETLLTNSQDQSFDRRGDVAVQVRRAALSALDQLMLYLLSGLKMSSFVKRALGGQLVNRVLAAAAREAISYHDCAREQASISFHRLCKLFQENQIPHAQSELIERLFSEFGLPETYQNSDEASYEFDWRHQCTAPLLRLLDTSEFSASLWRGLLLSLGQQSELGARHFQQEMALYMGPLEAPMCARLLHAFLDALEAEDLPERLLGPGLASADFLVGAGLWDCGASAELERRLLAVLRRAGQLQPDSSAGLSDCSEAKGPEPRRLLTILRILCALLGHPELASRSECLELAFGLLLCGQAKVRAAAADQLYLALLACPPSGQAEEQQEEAMQLLSETDWTRPLGSVRAAGGRVRELLLTGLGQIGH